MPKTSIIKSIKRLDSKKDLLGDRVLSLPPGRERLDNESLYHLLWYPTTERPNTICVEGFKPGNKDFWGDKPIYFTNSAKAAYTSHRSKKEVKKLILARVFIGLSYQLNVSVAVDQLPVFSREDKPYYFNSIFGWRDTNRDTRDHGKWYYGIFTKSNAEAIYIVSFEDNPKKEFIYPRSRRTK